MTWTAVATPRRRELTVWLRPAVARPGHLVARLGERDLLVSRQPFRDANGRKFFSSAHSMGADKRK